MKTLSHKFVEKIPEMLEQGVIYISIPYETVIHKCCCGCGSEVVTPLSVSGWSVTFNGETISLYPSIGNWSFPCRSHYFITENEVVWATKWSSKRIENARKKDLLAILDYFEKRQQEKDSGD